MTRTKKASAAPAPEANVATELTTAAPLSKIARVVALLERSQGASLAEVVEATGWLVHTSRAALTGLRKKGHVIDKQSRAGVTVYSISKAA